MVGDSGGFARVSRTLIVAMAAVVLSVSASALYARHRLSNTDEVLSIAANGAPSIRALATARMHLNRCGFELGRAVARPDASDPLALADSEHRQFHAALTTYLTLPLYPGERELQQALAPKVDALDAAYRQARAHAGDPAELRAVVIDRIAPAVVDVDGRLAQLTALDGDSVAAATRTIERQELRHDVFVYLLFAASFILAAIATLLVIRAVRRYFRVLDRRGKELEYFALQIGHDVLNPLTPIAAGLQLARDGARDEPVRQALERGLRGVDRIQRNISGLLAFARAGERSAADARAPLSRCIDGVVADLAAAAPRIVVERVDAVAARCDDGVLIRIVRAMLADALQRSGDGEVRVRALAARGRVRLEIAGGPALRGVDPFAPRIRGVSTGYPGIELEMLTARRLAETHGGRVGAATVDAHTVTFVELPT